MTVFWRVAVGAVIGGAIGYALYRFVGCRTGACPMTGNPYMSVILWGLMGAMVASGK